MMEKNEISTKKINSEIFIDAVRKHPCLYDKSLSEFKDTSYKKTIWTAIGIAFGITATEAEKKWKSFRDRYVKEKKKSKDSQVSGTGANEVYIPRWNLFKLLDGFLIPSTADPESITGNVDREMIIEDMSLDLLDDTDFNCSQITQSDAVQEQNDGVQEDEILIMNDDNENIAAKKRRHERRSSQKSSRDEYKEKLNDAFTVFTETSKRLVNNKENKGDRIDHFSASINVRLRAMNKYDQHCVMREIDELLYRTEEKYLVQ